MIGVLFLAGFAYHIEKDPFTDALTYVAQSGPDNGPMVAIECGAETDGQLAILVKSTRPMYRPEWALAAKYSERVRFDDAPMELYGFRYNGDYAVLTKAEARRFVAAAKAAATVHLEVEEFDGKKAQFAVPLGGATDSIAAVEKACGV